MLLGTARTGTEDKFDESHPFYQLFRQLGGLRSAHPALRTGAMIIRPTTERDFFAFSRMDRGEHIEYLVALNSSRTATLNSRVPTGRQTGAKFRRIFDSYIPGGSGSDTLTTDEAGGVGVTLPPLQFAVWQATAPLPAPAVPPQIALMTPAPAWCDLGIQQARSRQPGLS